MLLKNSAHTVDANLQKHNLNKTLARIAGVEPEDDETRQADED